MSAEATRPSSEAAAPRFFVSGATGYVGRALLREARSRGIAVYAHARPDSKQRAELEALCGECGAEPCIAGWEGAELPRALAALRPTHVFHLVGTTRARIRADRSGATSYARVDLGLLERLLTALRPLPHPPRLVYLSSLGAGPKARGAYLLARTRSEQAVEASGLPYTIVRPGLITGPDRAESRPHERLGALALGGVARLGGLILGAGFADRYRPMDARELAHGLVRAALSHTTMQRVLLAEELRWRTAVHRPDWAPRSLRDHGRH